MANILPTEKKTLAVSLLAEGSSIRAIERITGAHRDTIMRLGIRVGRACAKLQDERFRNLNCRVIQIDEAWGFIGKKRKNLRLGDEFKQLGDVWTFIALDSESKLVPCYRVGIRSLRDTEMFLDDLASRVVNRVQISSDQLQTYLEKVQGCFNNDVDYAQVVKTYAVDGAAKDAARRYSPAEIVKVEKKVICGEPDAGLISTSHIEKQNHTLRMHCRRLSRLTNAFSKKIENFRAAISLHFAYYNLCKRHIAVKATPAQAAGVEQHQWTVAELIERCGE